MVQTFGEWVREKREEKELSQEDLARAIREQYNVRLSSAYLSMIENGQRENLTTKLKSALIDYLAPQYRTQEDRVTAALAEAPELYEFWTILKEREDLQLLFKQAKKLSPESIRRAVRIIKAIEDEEDAND